MGRGLAAILSVAPRDEAEELRELAIELVVPNPQQPRTSFDEASLLALAESIKLRGVLQPVLVRALPGGRYELVAGERRWRAARLADLETIPAIVRHHDDAASLEVALVENMAREDLNPIEEARACAALVEELGLTRAEIGRRVGLPGRGVVLADPGLGKAKFVGPAQRLKIPAMAFIKAALGGMRGHCEQAVLHRAVPPAADDRNGTLGEARRIFSRNRMVAEYLSRAYLYAPEKGRGASSRVRSGGNDETTALIPAAYKNVASARKGDPRPRRPDDRRFEERRRYHAFRLHRFGARRRGSGPQGLQPQLPRPADLLARASRTPVRLTTRRRKAAAAAMLRRSIDRGHARR